MDFIKDPSLDPFFFLMCISKNVISVTLEHDSIPVLDTDDSSFIISNTDNNP